MKIKALTGFRYGDRIHSVGDIFEATASHAKALVALGRATYITEEPISETPTKGRSKKILKDTNEHSRDIQKK